MKNLQQINREILTTGVRVRATGEGEAPSRTIEGYAIVFGEQSHILYEDRHDVVREVIAPEAVTDDFLRAQDIAMVLFHNPESIMARSKNGTGTLAYEVDERGVKFSFDAPRTVEGDKCLELVRSGVLDGCSFKFTADYTSAEYVTMESRETEDGRTEYIYTVRKMGRVLDFTICNNPAYPQTEVAARMRDVNSARVKPADTTAHELRDAVEIECFLDNYKPFN